jgi:hypothetical protein
MIYRARQSAMKSPFSLLVLAVGCGIIGAPRNALGFEFAQGVIVDTLQSIVYMMNPERSIDAVSLSAGEVIATSGRGAKPLLVYDDVVLAEDKTQADLLSIFGLNAKDLKPRFQVDLPLPSQVRTGSFYASARIGSNEIIVRWRSVQRPTSAIPTHEPTHVTVGFARIDRSTGRLIATGEGEPSVPETSQVKLPDAVRKLADEGALASPFCWLDNIIAAIQYVEEDGQKIVTLRRWNRHTGEGLSAVSLFRDELSFRGFSRDCRNLLASRGGDGWIWHIYSVVTGVQIAEIRNSLPGAEFFVSEGKLIYEAPAMGAAIHGQFRIDSPRLVAVELNTGRELWGRPVGETVYPGPYPGNPPNPSTKQIPTERK